MITAYATVETARKAFKLGASDYLVKPFEFEELLVVINQKLKMGLGREAAPASTWYLGSKNSAFLQMIEVAEKFASTDMPVLLTGESGTGKEVIADFIHFKSGRYHLPFVKINCAAIPESLLESELFGYERGAFTGAESRKIGKFEEADKGTLLLDEIGDMPLQLQAKILRVLQDFEFSRLGGQERIRTDTRVFASSNQSLGDAIHAGKFRGDLYHRLNGVQVHIPPLRERKEDLQGLADFFLERFNRKYDKTIEGFSTEACTALQSYDWPGNIRELRNYVERAVVICEERCIGLNHLPDSLAHHGSFSGGAMDEYRHNYIRRVIIDALNKSNGSRLEAARMLKVSRKTLYNWMRDLKIENEYK
jgi:DNA-binding NtrC family response regulator